SQFSPSGKRVRWNSWGRRLTDLSRARIWQTATESVNTIFAKLPIPAPETPSSFSSACTTKRFPSAQCASVIQIVRPSKSTADTQPQPPSGFAEIVSDDFLILHAIRNYLI